MAGFGQKFGCVEVIYIWKIDQITAVTFEESRMTGKLFFKKVKGSNRFHSLSGDQMKGHTFILSLCVFDLMKIKMCIRDRVELYDYYGSLKHGYFNSVLGQKEIGRASCRERV